MGSSNTCHKILKCLTNRLSRELEGKIKNSELCLCQNGSLIPSPTLYVAYKTGDLNVFKYKPGEIVIKASPEHSASTLFKHPHVQAYHQYLTEIWNPPHSEANVFLPCTRLKPYRQTVTHRQAIYYVRKLSEKGIKVKLFSISEPMLVVPLELEEYYPLSNYDFPPYLMRKWEKEVMINKLSEILPKFINTGTLNVFLLPKHHMSIVREALKRKQYIPGKQSRIVLRPYGRLSFHSIKKSFEFIYKYFDKVYE